MIVIGLTGASGAGKGLFGRNASEKHGALHIDTDKTARQVVEPGKPCLEEIKAYFGEGVINPDGSLDRKALGRIVFSDTEKLSVLNGITHRYITAEVREALCKAEKDGYKAAIIDAPLLFESGEDSLCDVTVGVIAEKSARKQRIIMRDGITEEMADNRIASGKDSDFFKDNCNYILENNQSDTDFLAQADKLILEIYSKYGLTGGDTE